MLEPLLELTQVPVDMENRIWSHQDQGKLCSGDSCSDQLASHKVSLRYFLRLVSSTCSNIDQRRILAYESDVNMGFPIKVCEPVAIIVGTPNAGWCEGGITQDVRH